MTRDNLGARVRGLIEEHLANTPRLTRKDPPAVTDDAGLVDGLDLDLDVAHPGEGADWVPALSVITKGEPALSVTEPSAEGGVS